MQSFDAPDDARLAQARQDFADETLADELLAATGGALSASRLYGYARRQGGPADLEIERLLRANPGARALYRRFVSAGALYHAPQAMAASSDAVPPRAGDHWRIVAERSQAEPGQYIVVVELGEGHAQTPTTLVLCDREDAFHHFEVPQAVRGVIQLISGEDDALIRLLRDPATEVWLR